MDQVIARRFIGSHFPEPASGGCSGSGTRVWPSAVLRAIPGYSEITPFSALAAALENASRVFQGCSINLP